MLTFSLATDAAKYVNFNMPVAVVTSLNFDNDAQVERALCDDVVVTVTQDKEGDSVRAEVSILGTDIKNIITRTLNEGDGDMLGALICRLNLQREASSLLTAIATVKKLPDSVKVGTVWIEDADKTGITVIAKHQSGSDYIESVYIKADVAGSMDSYRWSLLREDSTVITVIEKATPSQASALLAVAIEVYYRQFEYVLNS